MDSRTALILWVSSPSFHSVRDVHLSWCSLSWHEWLCYYSLLLEGHVTATDERLRFPAALRNLPGSQASAGFRFVLALQNKRHRWFLSPTFLSEKWKTRRFFKTPAEKESVTIIPDERKG
ncbi:hypothetical protein HCN83_04130 [Bacillus luteus]|uniref:Uncharacterized protein n=2 Tax=Alkalicoccus luteus TaxID=1237094 RepID=A0A969PSK4_9BACI|nr:hypothetical protein [Alkalicoccus luteus]